MHKKWVIQWWMRLTVSCPDLCHGTCHHYAVSQMNKQDQSSNSKCVSFKHILSVFHLIQPSCLKANDTRHMDDPRLKRAVPKRRTPKVDLRNLEVALSVQVLEHLEVKITWLPKILNFNLIVRCKLQKRNKYQPKHPWVVRRTARPNNFPARTPKTLSATPSKIQSTSTILICSTVATMVCQMVLTTTHTEIVKTTMILKMMNIATAPYSIKVSIEALRSNGRLYWSHFAKGKGRVTNQMRSNSPEEDGDVVLLTSHMTGLKLQSFNRVFKNMFDNTELDEEHMVIGRKICNVSPKIQFSHVLLIQLYSRPLLTRINFTLLSQQCYRSVKN